MLFKYDGMPLFLRLLLAMVIIIFLSTVVSCKAELPEPTTEPSVSEGDSESTVRDTTSIPDSYLSQDHSEVETSGVIMTIKNGCGVEGAAAKADIILRGIGYRPEVENTIAWHYAETWIIFRNSDYKPHAIAIQNALGKGSLYCTYPSKTGWDYEGDILVVIGLDWANQNMREEGDDFFVLPNSTISPS